MADPRPQPSAEPVGDLIERAKARAMTLRWHEPIPVRVFVRDGCVIWSKVDDNNCNLTVENSEGMLYHAHSLFVPHGAENPLLTARPQPSAEPVAWLRERSDPDGRQFKALFFEHEKDAFYNWSPLYPASALEAARREALEPVRKWRDNLKITQGSPIAGDYLHGPALDFVIECLDGLLKENTNG